MYSPLTGFKNEPKLSNCIKAFKEHPDLMDEIKAYYLIEKLDDNGAILDRHLVAETTWKSGDFVHFTHKISGKEFKDPYEGHEGPTDGRDFEGQFGIIKKKTANRILQYNNVWGKVTRYKNIEDIPVRDLSKQSSYPLSYLQDWYRGDDREGCIKYFISIRDKYPYSGKAYRVTRYNKLNGIGSSWSKDQDNARDFSDGSLYEADIVGIDLSALASEIVDEQIRNNIRIDSDAQDIRDIEEVVALELPKNIKLISGKQSSLFKNRKRAGSTLYSKLEDIKHLIDRDMKLDHVKDEYDPSIVDDNLTAIYRIYSKTGVLYCKFSVERNGSIMCRIFEGNSKDPSSVQEQSGTISDLLKAVSERLSTMYGIEKAPIERENMSNHDKEFLKSIGIQSKLIRAHLATKTYIPDYLYHGGPDESGPTYEDNDKIVGTEFPEALVWYLKPVVDPVEESIQNKVSEEIYNDPKYVQYLDSKYDIELGKDIYVFGSNMPDEIVDEINTRFREAQAAAGSKSTELLGELKFVPYNELPDEIKTELHEFMADQL